MQLAQVSEISKNRTQNAANETKVKFKGQLKQYCDIFTEGPICLGDGARIISKALNMDGIIGDFMFDQKIVISYF